MSYRNKDIRQAIALTNNVTDTQWFNNTLAICATAYCFPSPRIQFIAPEGTQQSSNNKGQVFSYLGDNVDGFITEFSQYGLCVTPYFY